MLPNFYFESQEFKIFSLLLKSNTKNQFNYICNWTNFVVFYI